MMGAIYFIECLDDKVGVQIGKHFGLVSNILTEKEMDTLYEGKSLVLVGGAHQEEGDTGAILDAIEGSDWFEYREIPQKLLGKIKAGYQRALKTDKQKKKSEWGFWNDAVSLHDFYKDVINFIEEHHTHKIAWQSNGHFFNSRGMPTYHHPKHKPAQPINKEKEQDK